MNAASRARALVFGKTIGLVGAYVLAIWDVRTHIVNLSIAPGLLPLATADELRAALQLP